MFFLSFLFEPCVVGWEFLPSIELDFLISVVHSVEAVDGGLSYEEVAEESFHMMIVVMKSAEKMIKSMMYVMKRMLMTFF